MLQRHRSHKTGAVTLQDLSKIECGLRLFGWFSGRIHVLPSTLHPETACCLPCAMQLQMTKREEKRKARDRARQLLGSTCNKCGTAPPPTKQRRFVGGGEKGSKKWVEVSSLHAHHEVPLCSRSGKGRLGSLAVRFDAGHASSRSNEMPPALAGLTLLCADCHKQVHQPTQVCIYFCHRLTQTVTR